MRRAPLVGSALVLAGAVIMGRGALTDFLYVGLAVVVFFLLLKTRINPAYPIVASGVIGLMAHWLEYTPTT